MSHRIEDIAKGLPGSTDFIEPELSNLSAMYVQDGMGFIARQMLPAVPVSMQGGKFWEYSKADFNRDEMEVRADGAQAALGGYERSQKTYFCDVYALAKDVGPQELANNPRADRNATRYLANKALLKGEVNFSTACWGTGKWTTEYTGKDSPSTSTQLLSWEDADADPISQLETVIAAFEIVAAGFPCNRLAFGANAWRVFKNHPNVIARFNAGQTQGGAVVTAQSIAALLGIERVLVGKAVKTTSLSGDATPSFARVLAEDGVLGLHSSAVASLEEPSGAYNFDWTGYAGASATGSAIFEEMVPLTRGTRRFTIEHATQTKLIAADLGFWLEDIVTGS